MSIKTHRRMIVEKTAKDICSLRLDRLVDQSTKQIDREKNEETQVK